MKVFLSWSGERSRALASALNEFLPNVIQAIKPFMSESGIDAGTRWGPRLASELQDTKFSILCLTPENLKSEWMLFEAGALSKTIPDSFVCPCLFDVSPADLTFPLAQFQAKKADKDGIRSILESANLALGENGLEPGHLGKAFDTYFPSLEEAIGTIGPAPKDVSTKSHRTDRELLVEILEHVRHPDAGILSQDAKAFVIKRCAFLCQQVRHVLSDMERDLHDYDSPARKACGLLAAETDGMVEGFRGLLPPDLVNHLVYLAASANRLSSPRSFIKDEPPDDEREFANARNAIRLVEDILSDW